ncbi:MAG: FHA domain-containing protein, partial [Planctomycetota bacterium]
MAFLVWENEGKSVSQALESDILIGRSPGNDIVLADKLVSGFHARIIFQDGAWVFEDLGSTNGSFTNEALQERATLKHGDFIRIGHTRFAFRSTLDEDTQEAPLLADKEFLNLRRGYDVNRADGGIAGKIED